MPRSGNEMKSKLLSLVLVSSAWLNVHPVFAVYSSESQSVCPTIQVECTDDIDKKVLVFKAKLSGGDVSPSVTYKWSVHGGEIKDGQGTPTVTISNFTLRQKSLTVVVEVGGLPETCSSKASCTISV